MRRDWIVLVQDDKTVRRAMVRPRRVRRRRQIGPLALDDRHKSLLKGCSTVFVVAGNSVSQSRHHTRVAVLAWTKKWWRWKTRWWLRSPTRSFENAKREGACCSVEKKKDRWRGDGWRRIPYETW